MNYEPSNAKEELRDDERLTNFQWGKEGYGAPKDGSPSR